MRFPHYLPMILRDVEGAGSGESAAPPPTEPNPSDPVADFDFPAFDPNDLLGDNTEEPPTEEQTPSATPAPGDGQGAIPPVQPPTQPQPDPRQQEFDTLRTENTELRRQIAQIAAGMAQQTPAQRPAAEPPPNPYLVRFNPQVISALRSENPAEFEQGMQAVLAEFGMMVHQNVMREMHGVMNRVVPATISSHQQKSDIAQDFYAKYPRFNNPMVRQYVGKAAMDLARQQGTGFQWTPQFRDAVAKEVVKRIQADMPPTRRPQPQQPPAPLAPAGARGGVASGRGTDPNSPEAIADMLGL